MRYNINVYIETNFCKALAMLYYQSRPVIGQHNADGRRAVAYRETIGYLLEQKRPATWTLCTGSQGDVATHPIPAMTQGALFSMATAACRENAETNVRFNEVYLMFRVEVDRDAAQHGCTSASDFAIVYEGILANPEIRSSRVRVDTVDAIKKLKYERKF